VPLAKPLQNRQFVVQTMLKDIGVAVTPGIDFDPDRGRGYIRFCYAGPEARMREAARRINGWLKGK
jgi:aspartate/methionine/tyrosine aminotransferase